MKSEMAQELFQAVEQTVPWAVALRREFHKWPESGNEEHRTTARIASELKDMGISVSLPLSTGVTGLLDSGRKGPVIGLRADIDALPVNEQLRLPYSSERPGFMHACGHDVHTAILLGAARVLAGKREDLPGSVTFIFQPAEETVGGAERMIDAGCLKNPDVDEIYGLHVKPELPAGEIGLKQGRVHASSDQFRIFVRGRTGHGAYPESGIDAIVAASEIVCGIQTIVSRSVSPLCPAVVSVGSFHGGQAANTICELVELCGTIRSFNPEVRELLCRRIEEVAEHTAKAAGASAEVEFARGYKALINHDEPLEKVRRTGVNLLGEGKVIELEKPSLGVEDFSFYLEKIPGAFFFLGSGFRHRENPPLHAGNFYINEACIATGILMLCGLCLQSR